jgi:hypothetical protein
VTGVPYASRRRRISRRTAILVAVALAGLIAIGVILAVTWGGATSRFDGFVYVESNRAGRNTILAYRFSGSRLSLLAEHPTGGRGVVDFGETGALDAQGQIAVDRKRRLLFAVNQGSDSVAVFRLRRDGGLTPVSGSPFRSGGKAPASVSVAGPFLVVVDKAHDVDRDLHVDSPVYRAFRIGADGRLTPAGTGFRAEPSSSPTQALPMTPRLLVSTEETGPFRVFSLGADGSFRQGPNSPLQPEPSIFPARYDGARWAIGLARHPHEPLVYANQSATEQLLVYAVDRRGRLRFVRAVHNTHADLPCWTVVTPDGRRLFTANAGNGSISSFDLSRDPARPRRIQTLALKGGANPWGLALDPSGRTLFVVDPRAVDRAPRRRGNRLHVVHVESDGHLRELGSSPVRLPVGKDASPLGIAVVQKR